MRTSVHRTAGASRCADRLAVGSARLPPGYSRPLRKHLRLRGPISRNVRAGEQPAAVSALAGGAPALTRAGGRAATLTAKSSSEVVDAQPSPELDSRDGPSRRHEGHRVLAEERLVAGFNNCASDASSEKPRAVERAEVDEKPAVSIVEGAKLDVLGRDGLAGELDVARPASTDP